MFLFPIKILTYRVNRYEKKYTLYTKEIRKIEGKIKDQMAVMKAVMDYCTFYTQDNVFDEKTLRSFFESHMVYADIYDSYKKVVKLMGKRNKISDRVDSMVDAVHKKYDFKLGNFELKTSKDIVDFFQSFNNVCRVYVGQPEVPGEIDVYVHSYIYLSEKIIKTIKEKKPENLSIIIHNHALVGAKNVVFRF
jgi:hypothetical protein